MPLVKPQFEAGRGAVDRGVVRDPAVHLDGPPRGWSAQARELGLAAGDVIASPILGPDGNREFLLRLDVGPAEPGAARVGDPALDRLTDERLVEVTGA